MSQQDRNSLLTFFALTFTISWVLWIPAAWMGQHYLEFPTALLFLLGGFGPSAAAVILVLRGKDRAARRDFWKRAFDFKRISPGWYVLIAAAFPALTGAAYWIASLAGAPPAPAPGLALMISQPLAFLPGVLITLLAGPLSEELGWRGYALDFLQKRWSALAASLILGVIWWAWHLPLFSIVGTTHHGWGWFTTGFWLFLANVIPLSLFLTWAYNYNQRSTLSAVLIHFAYNFTLGLVHPVPEPVEILRVVLSWLAVALLVGLTRSKPGYQPRASSQ